MAVPGSKVKTLGARGELVRIYKARMLLMGSAMSVALAEARAGQPGACERIVQILEPARLQHLQRLHSERHV